MPGGKCVFNAAWLRMDCYSNWLVQDKLKPGSCARCKLCLKSFDITNMGEAALKSHMTGKKHQQLVPQKPGASAVEHPSQFVLSANTCQTETAEGSECDKKFVEIKASTAVKAAPIATKNDVLSAEVLWALKICSSHYSNKSSEHSDLLFQKMFPDSAIASSFKCGEVKSAYLINHGIAPHFRYLVSDQLKGNDCQFVLLFDESLNRKTQLKQMDVHVHVWEGHEV
jgi:hypothetical protein